MKILIGVFLLVVAIFSGSISQAEETCKVPDKADKLLPEARATCLKNATFSQEFKYLTPQDLRDGQPDFHIKANEMNCEFIYLGHYGGKSLKFFCVAADENGSYYNAKQQLVPEAQSFNPNGELLGADKKNLLDADGKKQKGLIIKVKYPSDAGTFSSEKRYREVFTEVAGTRLLWAMGLNADTIVQVEKMKCKGCNSNPYFTKQAVAENDDKTFLNVAVENRLDGKSIESFVDEGWKLSEIDQYYDSWSTEKQIDYLLLLTVGNIINHHNTKASKQNTVKCPRTHIDPETLECSAPIALFDDVGSTFGGSGFLFSANPRGEFGKYSKHRIFKQDCEFKIGGNVKTLTKAAQTEFIKRASNLTEEHVEAIVDAARFELMDNKQLERLNGNKKRAAKEWSDKISSLIEEIKEANCQ